MAAMKYFAMQAQSLPSGLYLIQDSLHRCAAG
jgi:hypothetical protein